MVEDRPGFMGLALPHFNLKLGGTGIGGSGGLARLGRRRRPAAGIDIGQREIRGAVAGRSRNGLSLHSATRLPTPPGSLENGSVVKAGILGEALREVAARLGAEGGRVVTAVPGRHVITRQLRLPQMPAEEIGTALEFEAERLLPLPPRELVLDYLELGQVNEDGQTQLELLVIALPRSVAFKLVEAFGTAGLQLVALEVEAMALSRLLLPAMDSSGDGNGQGLALVDVGATSTGIAVFRSGRPRLLRAVASGGDLATEAVAASFGLDLEAARKLLEQDGAVIFGTLDLSPENESKLQLETAIRAGFAELVGEIRRSLDFFEAQAKNGRVESITAVGGPVRMKGFVRFLEEELGVRCAEPQVNLAVEPQAEAAMVDGRLDPAFCLAAGLALREISLS